LSEEKEKRGLNKTQIGKLLGLDRSAISKKFDGRHNMTLETLADLAFALDRPVKVMLPQRVTATGSNQPASPLAAVVGGLSGLASIKSAIEDHTSAAATANSSPHLAGATASRSDSGARSGLASFGQGLEGVKQ
jgi:transcriptional regulator with XRE-family HTH domain